MSSKIHAAGAGLAGSLVLAMTLTGCGGGSTSGSGPFNPRPPVHHSHVSNPPTSNPPTSNPPDPGSPSPSGPDTAAVLAAMGKAADIVNHCGVSVFQIADAQTFAQGQRLARTYRTALFGWDAALRKIDFPQAATPKLYALFDETRDEIADLDALGETSNAGTGHILAGAVLLDDARDYYANEQVHAALGDPDPADHVRYELWQIVDDTYNLADEKADAEFAKASAANDFNALIEANVHAEKAVLAYLKATDKLAKGAHALNRFDQTAVAALEVYVRRIKSRTVGQYNAAGSISADLDAFNSARRALAHELGSA